MNYYEWMQWAKDELENAGIADAKTDAWLLMAYVTGFSRNAFFMQGQTEMPDALLQQYKKLTERRKQHIPLQHITGVQEFMGLDFFVNEDVLIPRQDTETLVETTLNILKDKDSVLDMCTGSGCILISLLKMAKGRQLFGTGADLSERALVVAQKNAQKHQTEATFIQSDCFENITDQYAVIVSNPPYIRTREIDNLMPEVKEHDPYMALDGREDGLYFYQVLTRQAPAHLKNGGYLLYEIGNSQGREVRDILKKNGFLDIQVIQDLSGNDRVVCGHL